MKRMFELNNTLPPHGFIGCRSCYPTADDSHKFRNSDGTKWKIEQPNATWGSQTPEVVVLGFSRGGNQSKPGLAFDEIAFKGMRTQLGRILEALSLVKSIALDSRIRAGESHLSFGSLVRCSVSQWDEKTENYSKSGNSILQKFAKGDATRSIATQCVRNFLADLPTDTKLVVMLGNEEKYIKFCYELVSHVRGEAVWVNPMAYDSQGVRFVHVIHAKAQGRLIPDWLTADGSQVQKRTAANSAVRGLNLQPT